MTPIPFHESYNALLSAMGFMVAHHEAHWQDVGGPESGPKLIGHPAFDRWSKVIAPGIEYEIIVIDGDIVEMQQLPSDPNLPF